MQNLSGNDPIAAIRKALLLAIGLGILRAFRGGEGPGDPGLGDEEPFEILAEANA